MAPRKGDREKGAIRLWIVESHPLAAGRLREILHRSRGILATGLEEGEHQPEGAYGRSPIALVDRDTLPGPLDECLRSLRSALPTARVLVLGRRASCEDTCALLFSGAKGFVAYEEVEGRLVAAVHAISEGHLWVRTEALQEFVQEAAKLSRREGHERAVFTAAEKHVLALLQRRLSNKEIASEMQISERTVKFHLGNIFIKAGVHDRYSVIDMAREGKLRELRHPWGDRKESEGCDSDLGRRYG